MEIYSTLTRSKETFETMNDNRINLFVCGPTVYDDAHIGHGRTYISFDTIKDTGNIRVILYSIFKISLMLMIR